MRRARNTSSQISRKWIRNAADEKAVAAGCYFDLNAADRVREFFAKFLRHSKGQFAGQPFELLDWQWRDLIGPLYGWKRPDGRRRFRFASVWIPKKNGKSTLAAGIVLNSLVNDDEPGAEVYGAAADRFQAKTVFEECAAMVGQSPALAELLNPVPSTSRIVYPAQNSVYMLLSKDSKKTGHGKNISAGIIDEVHVVSRELYATLRYGGAARRQPIFFEISTAGDDPTSFGKDRYDYAKKVLKGEIEDPELLPVIYEVETPAGKEPEDLWEDPEQWHKANPSLGVTITEESFRADFLTAKNGTPLDKKSFCQLRLNIWQKGGGTPWIQPEKWAALAGPPPGPLDGRDCYGGLDLATTTDTVSLVLAFPFGDWPEPECVYYLVWIWVPEGACRERERLNRTRFDLWIAEEHIIEVPGAVIDFDLIRKQLNELNDVYAIRKLALDKWNAVQLGTQLAGDGFEVEWFGQGFASMSGPTKELEKLILSGRARHGGNKALNWMVGNAQAEKDAAGNVKLSKKTSREKIDGAVAAVMATGAAMVEPANGPSITFI